MAKHPQAERVYTLTDDQKEKLGRAAALRNLSKSEYIKTVVMAQVERDLADAQFAVTTGQGPLDAEGRWQERLREIVDKLAQELLRAPRADNEKK